MWFWQFFKWNSKETTIAAEKSLEENSKNACVEAWTQTEEENGYNCREKLLMVLCIASILTAVVTGCILAYSKTSLSSTHPCGEAVKKIQTLEINKANNRSDVVRSNEFETSSSNEANATDIKKWEGISKTLAAEMNKTDQSEIAGSDIPDASAANQADAAETDESEPLPQPVLIVTEVGSTYLEVVWVLSEESKTNAAHIHYIVLFRKYGAQWQEVTFPDATRTSYSLTNLDRGMSYQIYVMAVDSSGFSRRSDIATVRTSNKVIYHNSPKGHEKQFVLYATAIILVVIVIACVYGYSKTSLSATQPYEENMGAAHSRKKMSSIKESIKKNSEVEKGRFTPNIQFGFHSSSINENEIDIDIAKESKERGNINIQKDSVQIKNPERNIFDHKLKSLKKKYQNRRENRELKDKSSIEECCEEEDYSSKFHPFATDEYYPSSLNPFAPEEDYPSEINPFESENSVNALENNSDDEQNENSSNDNLLLINDKEINNSIDPID